jgi:antitoxin VapB
MPKTAKLVTVGEDQTVVLPPEFRFNGQEVMIRRNKETGEVILSPRLSWKEFLAQIDPADIPDDFLTPEDRNQDFPQEREGLFD